MRLLIILTIAVSLTGCGDNNRAKLTDSESIKFKVNGGAEKSSEMSTQHTESDSSGAWWMDETAKEYNLGLINGKKSTKKIQTYPSDEKRYETPHMDGKPHGLAKACYRSGSLEMAIPFVNGIRHGKTLGWYESGQKAFETPYVNGLASGTAYWWYETGDLQYETPFVNGQRDGNQKIWAEDGTLTEVVWEKGMEK